VIRCLALFGESLGMERSTFADVFGEGVAGRRERWKGSSFRILRKDARVSDGTP